MTSTVTVTLGTEHFAEANEIVRDALTRTDEVEIDRAFAQRYLGCALPAGKRLKIHGVPGNDMACYMDGGTIEVFGNAQDQIGNTMNDGCIVVHGRCGDAAGYGMRGGQIFVRDGCGWRVGIHMKQFQGKCPAIVIGGDAGNFLGEYLAGGIIVLLGEPGAYLATGMHGGTIYLARRLVDGGGGFQRAWCRIRWMTTTASSCAPCSTATTGASRRSSGARSTLPETASSA